MKLAIKLYLIFSVVLFVTTIFYGYFTYNREMKYFETDMKNDAQILGNAVASQISSSLQAGNYKKALELINEANQGERKMVMRMVWLEETADTVFRPHITRLRLSNFLTIGINNFQEKNDKGEKFLYTYIPLKTDSTHKSALEVAEPYSFLKEYSHTSMQHLMFNILFILVINLILTGIAGFFILGRRIQKLSDFAYAIGEGNLNRTLTSRGKDEISSLENSMNIMCGQLKIAKEKLNREMDARIAAVEQLRHTERLALLGRISSGFAHELGTPLNVVGGRAKLIAKENPTNDEMVSSAQIIVEQAKRMTNIIQQMLNFARRKKPNKTTVDIAELIKETVGLVNAVARQQNVSFKLPDKSLKNLVVIADSAQIQQVLMNILMNGIQSMPGGGIIELEVGLEKTETSGIADDLTNTFIVVRIKDNGIGISEKDMENIFEPFYTTKPAGKGTGLGLSIAAEIIRDHSGRLTVESEPGKGSCFSVYLPTGDTACAER